VSLLFLVYHFITVLEIIFSKNYLLVGAVSLCQFLPISMSTLLPKRKEVTQQQNLELMEINAKCLLLFK